MDPVEPARESDGEERPVGPRKPARTNAWLSATEKRTTPAPAGATLPRQLGHGDTAPDRRVLAQRRTQPAARPTHCRCRQTYYLHLPPRSSRFSERAVRSSPPGQPQRGDDAYQCRGRCSAPRRQPAKPSKGPPGVVGGPLGGVVFGGVLLSHTLAGAVPSALEGLASGFGMGPGVSPPLWPP
jgi:hypothetical protein